MNMIIVPRSTAPLEAQLAGTHRKPFLLVWLKKYFPDTAIRHQSPQQMAGSVSIYPQFLPQWL